jgi:hypothetical protein
MRTAMQVVLTVPELRILHGLSPAFTPSGTRALQAANDRADEARALCRDKVRSAKYRYCCGQSTEAGRAAFQEDFQVWSDMTLQCGLAAIKRKFNTAAAAPAPT